MRIATEGQRKLRMAKGNNYKCINDQLINSNVRINRHQMQSIKKQLKLRVNKLNLKKVPRNINCYLAFRSQLLVLCKLTGQACLN